MEKALLISIIIVSVAIFSCFAYSFYQTNKLQAQITTLQQSQNAISKATAGHMVVLNYNWTVQHVEAQIYMLIVNATLFNDSPSNTPNNQFQIYVANNVEIYYQFNDKTSTSNTTIGDYGPYMVENEGFTVEYNSSDYFGVTSPNNVWLELTTVTGF